VIEYIQGFRPELDGLGLGHPDPLKHCQIEVEYPRTGKPPPLKASNVARLRIEEDLSAERSCPVARKTAPIAADGRRVDNVRTVWDSSTQAVV
jgi:hypothetical protein